MTLPIVSIFIALIAFTIGYQLNDLADQNPLSAEGDATHRDQERRVVSEESRLRRALKQEDSGERVLNLVAALEKATLADMLRIACATEYDERSLELVAHRWLELDPQHCFDTSLEEAKLGESGEEARFGCYFMMRFLAREWPKHDLEAAIKAASSQLEGEPLWDMREACLEHLASHDFSSTLALGKEWDMPGWGQGSKAFLDRVAENPQSAADTVVQFYPPGKVQDPEDSFSGHCEARGWLTPIAKAWAEKDPTAVLAYAGRISKAEGQVMRDIAFAKWAGQDDQAAAGWLAEQDDAIQDRYRPVLIREWAGEDPAAALAWCQEHFTEGKDFKKAVQNLAKGAALVDPQKMVDLLPELDSPRLRKQVARVIANQWFSSESGEAIPEAAVSWIGGISDPELRNSTVDFIQTRWVSNDAEGFQAFVSRPENAGLPASSIQQLVTTMAQQDPVHALKWAETFEGRKAQDLSGYAFRAWLRQRPAAAATWFRELPAGDLRRAELLHQIQSQLIKNPGAQPILDLLNSEDRAKVNQFLKQHQE